MIAFLAPGQNAEQRGMGLSVARSSPAAQAVLSEASSVLGQDMQTLLMRGGRELQRADVAQVAVAAVTLGAAAALREHGVTPAVTLGHSAGELAAACAAGHFTVRGALTAYAVRAQRMLAAAKARPGGMATLDGTPEALAHTLELGRARGVLVEAGRLAPTRWLLSGEEAALRHACAHSAMVRLDTAGAWHSPLMEPAVSAFRAALEEHRVAPAAQHPAVFLSSDDAEPVTPGTVVARLSAQLTRSMRFADTLAALARLAPAHLVLLGPSRTLRALVRLNFGDSPPFTVHGTESADELTDTLRQLS